MKKIEKRTVVCLILTLILLLGVGLFVVRFFLNGGSWASFAANRHLYNSQGQLSAVLRQPDGAHGHPPRGGGPQRGHRHQRPGGLCRPALRL